jgi:hypothetical protein
MTPSDEVLCQWYEARDTFLGINYYRRNYQQGLLLARRVEDQVPEAKWLCNLFRDFDPELPELALVDRLCKEHGRGVLDATCYLGIIHPDPRCRGQYFQQAWNQRHPLAFGRGWSGGWRGGERICLGLASRGCEEPCVLYAAGIEAGKGTARQLNYIKRAAELGFVDAFSFYARAACVQRDHNGFEKRDPLYFYWEGRAAQRGRNVLGFMEEASECLLQFLRGEISSAYIVQIEAMFEGHLTPEAHRLLRSTSRDSPQATGHYITVLCRSWRENARRAVNMWLLIGRRTRGMNRDMRRAIGRRIWDDWLRDVEYTVRTPDDCPIIITRDGDHTAPPCIMTRSSAMCQQLVG